MSKKIVIGMVMVLIVGFEWNMGFYQIGGNPASCSIIKGDIGKIGRASCRERV